LLTIFENRVFLNFGDRQTGRQIDEQVDSTDALSRHRYRERRLNKLEIMPQISSVATNVIKIMIPKMADTSKDEPLLGGEIRHIPATSQYHGHSKQVTACVSNSV